MVTLKAAKNSIQDDLIRLPVPNFGDGDSVAEKYTHARARNFRRASSRRVSSREVIFARLCISPESPKLETTSNLN